MNRNLYHSHEANPRPSLSFNRCAAPSLLSQASGHSHPHAPTLLRRNVKLTLLSSRASHSSSPTIASRLRCGM